MSTYKLVLIGETGSGKTSFLNLLCNCATIQDTGKQIDEEGLSNVKEFHDVALENPKSEKMESKISNAKLYNTKLFGLKVGVIDTPGFNDSRGFKQDEDNTKAIIQALKESKQVNCICLVINGRNSRISPSLKYVLAAITAILPKKIVENVIVILTNSADEDDVSFDTNVLQEFFQRKIPDKNIFYIDNPYCKLAKAQEKAKEKSKCISNTKAKNIVASFQITAGVLKEMHEAIKEFEPVHTNEFIALYEKKIEVELKVLEILKKYEKENLIQEHIRDQETEIEKALKQKRINEDYTSTKTLEYYDVEPLYGRHNTLCGAANCYSNCHMPCYLDMTQDKEQILHCGCMNGGTYCTVCGCHYAYHLHNRAKYVKKTEVKCKTDERMKQKFKDATTQQERADALKASYQEQLRESEKEKQRLSEELVTVIDDFEKCSISRNFASILESQLELIDQHIKGELSHSDGGIKSNLQETKEKLSHKLRIVERALVQRYA